MEASNFINFLEGLGYSAVDFKLHFYDLVFLPFLMASLALLASSLVKNLKQNDKCKNNHLCIDNYIFIYFASNLLNALGSTSQLSLLHQKV